MADTPEEIINSSAGSLKSLKKVLASRGRLQGNFYYAGDTKGHSAGIVVTLTARDPKGAKATAQGKPLRKIITGAKFARGTVSAVGSKLTFVVHSGTASVGHMRLGFKKAFADGELKSLKALLRKSIVKSPGGEESRPDSEDEAADSDEPALNEETAYQELSVKERAELAELIDVQGDLDERNQDLQASFLSAAEADQEFEEQLAELEERVETLLMAHPIKTDALRAARAELAAVQHTGPDVFPDEVGVPLDETALNLLSGAQELVAPEAPKVVTIETAEEGYRSAVTMVSRQIEGLAAKLRAEPDPDLVAIADRGLGTLTGSLRVPLEAALLEARAGNPSALGRVAELATEFADHLDEDPAVQAADENPFSAPVTLRAALAPALRTLSAAASAAAS